VERRGSSIITTNGSVKGDDKKEEGTLQEIRHALARKGVSYLGDPRDPKERKKSFLKPFTGGTGGARRICRRRGRKRDTTRRPHRGKKRS